MLGSHANGVETTEAASALRVGVVARRTNEGKGCTPELVDMVDTGQYTA